MCIYVALHVRLIGIRHCLRGDLKPSEEAVAGNAAAKATRDRPRSAAVLPVGFYELLGQERQVPWVLAETWPWLCALGV